MSIWTITSMNLPSASTAADPEHVATCSIASCSRQCRLIRSPTEISRAGKRTQTTTYSGYESEMDSHFEKFEINLFSHFFQSSHFLNPSDVTDLTDSCLSGLFSPSFFDVFVE